MGSLQIKKEDAVLVLIDFQERLMPAIKGVAELEATVIKLVKGAKVLGLPILVTQQYTRGLGPTVTPIAEAIGSFFPIEKLTFSAMRTQEFKEALEQTGKKTVIICGIESHICVQQTTLDLLEAGYEVFLIHDCVASRNNNDKKYAQRRMSEAGAIGTTYESALYEMLVSSKAEGFKEISAIVK